LIEGKIFKYIWLKSTESVRVICSFSRTTRDIVIPAKKLLRLSRDTRRTDIQCNLVLKPLTSGTGADQVIRCPRTFDRFSQVYMRNQVLPSAVRCVLVHRRVVVRIIKWYNSPSYGQISPSFGGPQTRYLHPPLHCASSWATSRQGEVPFELPIHVYSDVQAAFVCAIWPPTKRGAATLSSKRSESMV
jgi:hypothetical protein